MLESGNVAAEVEGGKAQDLGRADDGLVSRRFTTAGVHPFDEIEWRDEEKAIGFTIDDARWRCALADYTITRVEAPEEEGEAG